MVRYLTRDAPCIVACRQPALTLAFAHEHELPASSLLAGTRLTEASLLAPAQRMSPAQLLTVLSNLGRATPIQVPRTQRSTIIHLSPKIPPGSTQMPA